MQHQASQKGNSSWVCYLDLGKVDAGSALRQLGAVLALAAAVAATDIVFAQPFDPVARDIRTGVYRGHAVTYEVVDGLAIWDGDIILGTPEELSPKPAPTHSNSLDIRNKISATSRKEKLWPGGIVPYVLDPELTNPHVPDAIRHWEQKHPHPVRGKNGSAELGSLHAKQQMCGARRHDRGRAECFSSRILRPWCGCS